MKEEIGSKWNEVKGEWNRKKEVKEWKSMLDRGLARGGGRAHFGGEPKVKFAEKKNASPK